MAFPCNQFLGQEGKCELDIKNFTQKKFHVDFPLFTKINVNGPETHQVFRFLRANTDLFDEKSKKIQEIPWNFTKFLVDADGNVVKYFGPPNKPAEMEKDIEDKKKFILIAKDHDNYPEIWAQKNVNDLSEVQKEIKKFIDDEIAEGRLFLGTMEHTKAA